MSLDKIEEGIDFVKNLKAAKDIISGDDTKTSSSPLIQRSNIIKPRTKNYVAESGTVEPARVFRGTSLNIQQFLGKQLSNILNGKLASLIGGK